MNAFHNREPLAAESDPVTSRLAGADVTQSGRRDTQKRALLAWLRGAREPMTSAEIAAAGQFDRHGTARRLPDLAEDGIVERCHMRTCLQTGRPSVTWQVVNGAVTMGNRVAGHHRGDGGDNESAPAAAMCPCRGSGRIRISTEPAIWVFCDEARGKRCIHAEQQRRINPDPNWDLQGDAQNRTEGGRL